VKKVKKNEKGEKENMEVEQFLEVEPLLNVFNSPSVKILFPMHTKAIPYVPSEASSFYSFFTQFFDNIPDSLIWSVSIVPNFLEPLNANVLSSCF